MEILKVVGTAAMLLTLGNCGQDLDNLAQMQGPLMW